MASALPCAHAQQSLPYQGQVLFNTLPVPGATVTLTTAAGKRTTTTNPQGFFLFSDAPAGPATLDVESTGFQAMHQPVTVAPDTPAPPIELHLLTLAELRLTLQSTPALRVALPPAPTAAAQARTPDAAAPPPAEDTQAQSADGLLVNGSVNNAATSKYSLNQAFGNNRPGVKALYTGGLALIESNSTFDARPYSLSGLQTPKPAYNLLTGVFTVGGPARYKRFHGPDFFALYSFVRDRNDTDSAALVPTAAQRVTANPQAAALLNFYPLPNLAGDTLYNYQVPILTTVHADTVQTRLNKGVGRRDQFFGNFAFESQRTVTPNLFGFIDAGSTLGLSTSATWSHRFSRRLSLNSTFRFSRLRTRETPYFENTVNVSGQAGITGNLQDPMNYGPPTLVFTSGITPLTDGIASSNRNRTDGVTEAAQLLQGRHTLTAGIDFRRQEFNILQQGNPRGTFTFTGAAIGSDVADFLAGIPDTAAAAFGNADKYLRQNVYALYGNDDWRVTPSLTLNLGVRWEYGAPLSELKNRLVNLDVSGAPSPIGTFAAVAPVLASAPKGSLSGASYPASLLRPDRTDVEPRLGLSWRPIPASTVVVRAGYGVYADTSVYETLALQLAQQPPLSTAISVQNSPGCPLTLANGFRDCAGTTANTFAVDPGFRVGYAQLWQLSVQRDFPASLQVTATYLGVKGTRGNQEFLPNTNPIGAADPNPTYPRGFAYLASNGNSTREAGQLQVRRRLHNGFTASALYTYSKSLDDDAALGGQGPVASGLQAQSASPGSLAIAQDWRNLAGERGLSIFDQRHVLNLDAQYTSGQGIGGGTLLSGRRAALLKEWTLATEIVAATGRPENPVYPLAVPGTGFSGSIRPDRTGADLYRASGGYHLNQAAFTAPAAGAWGDARRNSITGPGVFTLNGSLARTFRFRKRFNLDLRIDTTNLLNHVTYTAWVTTINNQQFGLPVAANPQRSLQTTLRLRY